MGILVGVYDYVKDIIRFFSGVKDLFGKGSGQSGVMKIAGFTVGNMQRYVIMTVLFILAFVGFYILSIVSRRKISKEERDIVYTKVLMKSYAEIKEKEKVPN